MPWALKSLAAAAAFVAANSASAFTATLNTNESISAYGFTLAGLSGSSSLIFSSTAISTMNASKVVVTSVAPAATTVTFKTNGTTKVVSISSASAAVPAQSLTADITASGLVVRKLGTLGGIRQTVPYATITTTGGFLEISNLSLDLRAKKVFATLNGGNGIGLIDNVEIWDVTTITGRTFFDRTLLPINPGESLTFTNTLSGLKINANAYDLFVSSLGLRPNGQLMLSVVTDFGMIRSTITLGVPEPTTYALMGAGLLATGLIARRRHRVR